MLNMVQHLWRTLDHAERFGPGAAQAASLAHGS